MEYITEINERYEEDIPCYEDLEQNGKMEEKHLDSELEKEAEEILTNDKDKEYLAEGSEEGQMETRWMVPHFSIVKRDKETTKVRMVLDAAAKQNGISLNEAIFTGPKLKQDVAELLTMVRRDSRGGNWNFDLEDRKSNRTKNKHEKWKKWKRWKVMIKHSRMHKIDITGN